MVLEAAESWEKMSNSRCHLKAVVKQEISPHPRFSSFQVNGYTFEKKNIIYAVQRQYKLGAFIRSLKPLYALARTGLKKRFINSIERRPSRCVRVKVHKGARRLKFLRLGMPFVARIRRLKQQP